ncbi:MAG: cupin domain-containing protein [Arachnia sp.]
MGRSIITAAIVEQAVNSGTLIVTPGSILTPLARDVASELGVSLVREGGQAPGRSAPPSHEADLTGRIRGIVASMLAAGTSEPAPAARRRVLHASIRDAILDPFPYPGPPADMSVNTRDVVTAEDGSPMAVGYMSITRGNFPWTLTYDEAQVVLEGELHLGGDAGAQVGLPGDVLFVPKGSSITFGTPTWAKFVYITFPANWEGQIP